MSGGPEWESGQPTQQPPAVGVPMRLGTILEVTVRILRRHWRLLLALSIIFAGPGALLTAATGMRVNEVIGDIFPGLGEGVIDEGMVITDQQLQRMTGALAGYVVAAILAGVLASLGALGFSAVVAADYHARRLELGEALRTCLGRAPAALAFILISSVIIIGLLLGGTAVMLLLISLLPGASAGTGGPAAFAALVVIVVLVAGVVYLTLRWAPAFPAMVNEGLGAREALARSWHLSADNVWRILFIVIFGALAGGLLATVISQILGAFFVGLLTPLLGLDELIGESLALAFGTVLLASLAPVLTAVLYFDLRARRDVPAAAPSPQPH